MMNKFSRLFLVFIFLSTFRNSAMAEDKCTDLLIQFTGPETNPVSKDQSFLREITALVPCERRSPQGAVSIPTTLHIFERRGDQFCIAQRTCGNVSAWEGSFALTVGWSDLTLLGDFHLLGNSLRFHKDWNGNRLVASFAIGGGQIERDCSPLTPPSCVSVGK
jgi:hypothetical protein